MAKILFVEDEPDIRDLVRMALEDEHGVTVAGTAEEGLRRAAEEAPDLILMDISLPGIDGVEATRQLKGDPSTADIPIVALTASVLHSDRARFEEAGFVGLIAKPIDVLAFPEQVLAYCPERKDES